MDNCSQKPVIGKQCDGRCTNYVTKRCTEDLSQFCCRRVLNIKQHATWEVQKCNTIHKGWKFQIFLDVRFSYEQFGFLLICDVTINTLSCTFHTSWLVISTVSGEKIWKIFWFPMFLHVNAQESISPRSQSVKRWILRTSRWRKGWTKKQICCL